MSDGLRLRQSWTTALNNAESLFKSLLTSTDWRRVPTPIDTSSPTHSKGKARASSSSLPELSDVILHRKPGTDIYRVILEGEEFPSLEPCKVVLATPELRQVWDPAVEEARLVEMFDCETRICKTKFTLGWPANPRDAVTISRSIYDSSTVLDISTSLPRSPDEPSYLRPSPPYVRSNVTLFAWCIQTIPPPTSHPTKGSRTRLTCFWQHDLRAVWNFGTSTSLHQHLCAMILGLFKTVVKRGMKIPSLAGYGNGVSIERVRFQVDRVALTIEYAIIPEEENELASEPMHGMEELLDKKEHRRLARSIECILPAAEGWDVRITTKASSARVEKLPWTAHATKSSSSHSHSPPPSPSLELDQIILCVTHAPLLDNHSILKVKVTLELSGPSRSLRLNGLQHPIEEVSERDPSSFRQARILQDVGSTKELSLHTVESKSASVSVPDSASVKGLGGPGVRGNGERNQAEEKGILSRVRRNYIYFSSLLQEPEAKWKRTTEFRGVSITQLDSIDPTLVVYRAEATFVGVGLWDLYGTLVSPGARIYWDKQHDDAILLEDVNELTELWHFKTKPAWPVVGRDSVVLKTVYKSPSTIHVFSFSADDPHFFPLIPPPDPATIRTQVDLQGWAIEALSPTTTLLTLLEQSDPKGWTNKTSIPQQMINAVAGVGEFAIRCGGPPTVTRMAGAKANEMRYDHERGSFKVEYEGSAKRRPSPPSSADDGGGRGANQMPVIECELRCDIDTWATSLDIVVDPPPQSIACLRRHRLSAGGGGLWLTLTHDAVFVDDERLMVVVRKGPGKEKGLVMLNGTKVQVDVEEMAEAEIKALTKQKRVKPMRIPLDQPPVVGIIRRRRAEWNEDAGSSDEAPTRAATPVAASAGAFAWATAPRISTPLTKFLTSAVEQAASTTQQAVYAISPAAVDPPLSPLKSPMQYVLEALSWVQDTHPKFSNKDWTLVTEKGLPIHRKLCPLISPSLPVHRGQKVIEGVSGEELASLVTQYDCRKAWDDRFDSAHVFDVFGADAHTAFVVCKGGFPFRDRGFYLANVMARAGSAPNVIFCVASSFSPDSVAKFSAAKYNSYGLPTGRVFIDAWVFETLDPYTTENYAIPSTRVTRLVAMDYAGSIPAAVNTLINAALPRSILAIESYAKAIKPVPITRLPAPGLVLADYTKNAGDEPAAAFAWKLRRRDESRVLIQTRFNPEGRVYLSEMLLTMGLGAPRSPGFEEVTTPRPSTFTLKGGSTDLTEGLPASSKNSLASLAFPSPSRNRTMSSQSEHSRAVSHSRDRRLSSSGSRVGTSSAFTLRGEIRHSTDLLVGEVVVDSRLYTRGYAVALRSHIRFATTQHISLDSTRDLGDSRVLPLAYAVYTMPSSPLHSSGLNADRPTRHLIRFTLPTAQYQISTVHNPLTGETQVAPPKPKWLVDLQERGAVVRVEVKPTDKVGVWVEGNEARVLGEKESLTGLGREELVDDRMGRMALLSRSAGEADVIPVELTTPLAMADKLLDPATATLVAPTGTDNKETEVASIVSGDSEDTAASVVVTPEPAPINTGPASGLMGFLNSYPNPFLRFSSSTNPSPTGSTKSSPRLGATRKVTSTSVATISLNEPSPSSFSRVRGQLYPLSTIIIVALISFLVGSLLRSLLSPTDFIYVATDLRETEGRFKMGWREIRRLLEIRYIAAGWDFQVAIVRRH